MMMDSGISRLVTQMEEIRQVMEKVCYLSPSLSLVYVSVVC